MLGLESLRYFTTLPDVTSHHRFAIKTLYPSLLAALYLLTYCTYCQHSFWRVILWRRLVKNLWIVSLHLQTSPRLRKAVKHSCSDDHALILFKILPPWQNTPSSTSLTGLTQAMLCQESLWSWTGRVLCPAYPTRSLFGAFLKEVDFAIGDSRP